MKIQTKGMSVFSLGAKQMAAFAAVVILLASPKTFASNATWNGTTDTNWATTSNWSASPVPGSGNTATFNNAGNGNTTISLGSGVTIKTVLFNTASAAAYTIGSGAVGSQTLTLNSAGALTVNSSVVNNQVFNANITLSGNATLTDSGTGSLTLNGAVNDGTAGTLTVSATGNINLAGNITPTASLALTKTGTGTLTLSGAGTSTIANNLLVTNGQLNLTAGILNVTDTTGASTKVDDNAGMTVSGGTLNIGGTGGWFPIGDTAGATATLTVSSGAVNVTDNFGTEVGRNGTGIFTITGGTFLNNDAAGVGFIVSDNAGPGGTVNLNGGTMVLNKITHNSTSTAHFYFNGGTLSPTASSTTWFPANSGLLTQIRNGGGIIDDTGLNVEIDEPLAHSTVGGDNAADGGLTKRGTGTLTLTAAETYTGNTTISAGTLLLGSGGSLVSSNIMVGSNAIFDVSANSFSLASGQGLAGYGNINGSVNTTSGSQIYAGTDGGYGTNTFNNNLTLASGAICHFDLGATYNGPNDLINVHGSLVNNGAVFINAPSGSANLDTNEDYVLMTSAGLSGSVSTTPLWGVTPLNWRNFTVVTNGNNIQLHYTALIPPTAAGSVTPNVALRNQSVFVSVTVTPGTGSVDPGSGVVLDASSIGLSSSVPLPASGMANVYTNTLTIPLSSGTGNFTLKATVTDSTPLTGSANIGLTILATNQIWNGEGPDNLFDDNANWASGNAPGYVGDAVAFAGTLNTSPDMDHNYTVSSLLFNPGAGNFTIASVEGDSLTVGSGGIANNSTNPQTLNVPVNLSASESLDAAAGNLTFGSTFSATGLLTVNGSNTVTLAGAGTSSVADLHMGAGQLNLTAGTLNVSGTDGTITGLFSNSVVTVSGGTLNIQPGANVWFPIGNSAGGTATLTISGTGIVNIVDHWGAEVGGGGLVGAGGAGILNINGGKFVNNDIGAIGLIVGESGSQGGTLNLNGGILQVNNIHNDGPASTFYFNGGTLSPTASSTTWFAYNAALVTQVRNGGAIIDDTGLDVEVDQTLAHSTVGGDNPVDGGLIKKGGGVLTLTSVSTYTGDTLISNGTLALGASGSIISSNIIVGSSAIFDVSAVSSYTLGAGQNLLGNGSVNGAVDTAAGSAIYPGTDGTPGALTFTGGGLTLSSGATVNFDLSTNYNGANDQITVSGLLTANGNAFHIKAPSTLVNLDASADYILMTATSIAGSFSSTPVWDVQPLNAANFFIVTDPVNNQVRLHYSVLTPPTGSGVATPSTATNNQSVFISVTVTNGSGTVDPNSGVVLNASIIGGSPSVPLVLSSTPNVYTNTITVPPSAAGGIYTLSAVITDSNDQTGIANILLNVFVPTGTVNGGPQDGAFHLYGNYFLHDPGTLIKQSGRYFIWGDGQGVSGVTTTDLRNWTAQSPIFPGNPPAWTTNAVPGFTGYNWAPDNAYFNGQYYLYYVCSIFGTINSAIGLVTTPSLISPVWTDQGKVIQSNPVGETNATTDLTSYNCIDPSIMVDTNGTVWLSFGSYSDGILIMQLNPTTGKRISTNSPLYRVANNGPGSFSNTEEGSYLHQHGGYYYLFCNWDGCCAGVNSTYNIRYGRSTNVTGPYYDKNGVNLVNGGGTLILESSGRYIGPGHAAIMNDNGTNWFTFHYYDGNNNGAATLALMRLNWSADGWPELTNDWSAFYTFNTDAREHFGVYNGTLKSGAAITNDALFGNVLHLDGKTNYVVLPDPIANCRTIMTWVKWNGGSAGQHLFDFGTDTTNYYYLTPQSTNGTMSFAINTSNVDVGVLVNSGGEVRINAASALPTNTWCHVAVTLDGTQGLLYLDGVPIATNSSLAFLPWMTGWESAADGTTETNFIGKSKFGGAPLFDGEISSFRVFGRALTGAEIQGIAMAPPSLAHRYSFASNEWESISMAHGTLMGNATILNHMLQLDGVTGDYLNLPGGLVSDSSAVTLEFWATFGTNGSGAQVADFGTNSGSSGQDYFSFSPHDASGDNTLELNSTPDTIFANPGTFDNTALHVVCIVDPTNRYAAVYTNGVLENAVTNTWPAFTSVSGSWSFIGRSLFSSDSYLNATINELRIYDGRLTPQQIATDYQLGPDTLGVPVTQGLPPALGLTSLPAGVTFSWPSWAIGYSLQYSTNLDGGVWSPVPQAPVLTNGQWLLNLVPTNPATFFRLQQ